MYLGSGESRKGLAGADVVIDVMLFNKKPLKECSNDAPNNLFLFLFSPTLCDYDTRLWDRSALGSRCELRFQLSPYISSLHLTCELCVFFLFWQHRYSAKYLILISGHWHLGPQSQQKKPEKQENTKPHKTDKFTKEKRGSCTKTERAADVFVKGIHSTDHVAPEEERTRREHLAGMTFRCAFFRW